MNAKAEYRIAGYLSSARLEPYLRIAKGDLAHALEIYKWNVELSSAFLEVLAVTEVVIRNAIDRELKIWNQKRPKHGGGFHSEWWTMDPASQLRSLNKTLVSAKAQAEKASRFRSRSHPRHGATVNHDDIVAQLTFGTWPRLMPSSQPSNRKKQALWNHALVHAFPNAAANSVTQILQIRGETLVYSRMMRLVQLRNRAAHLESLLEVNVPARLTDVLQLLKYVDTAARTWGKQISRVCEVNDRRPFG